MAGTSAAGSRPRCRSGIRIRVPARTAAAVEAPCCIAAAVACRCGTGDRGRAGKGSRSWRSWRTATWRWGCRSSPALPRPARAPGVRRSSRVLTRPRTRPGPDGEPVRGRARRTTAAPSIRPGPASQRMPASERLPRPGHQLAGPTGWSSWQVADEPGADRTDLRARTSVERGSSVWSIFGRSSGRIRRAVGPTALRRRRGANAVVNGHPRGRGCSPMGARRPAPRPRQPEARPRVPGPSPPLSPPAGSRPMIEPSSRTRMPSSADAGTSAVSTHRTPVVSAGRGCLVTGVRLPWILPAKRAGPRATARCPRDPHRPCAPSLRPASPGSP